MNRLVEKLQSYQLTTIRCLLQLSNYFAHKYPDASEIMASDLYDHPAPDLLCLCAEIHGILKSDCFLPKKVGFK